MAAHMVMNYISCSNVELILCTHPECIIVTLLKQGYSHIYLIMTLIGVMLINGNF